MKKDEIEFDSSNIKIKGLKSYLIEQVNEKEFIVNVQVEGNKMPVLISLRDELLNRLQERNLFNVDFTLHVL